MNMDLKTANCWKLSINNSIPKSKNMNLETISSQNINKELAYLLGVYLSDGSISQSCKGFSLKTIDKEFAELTLSCIKKILPDCKSEVYLYNVPDRIWDNGNISKCKPQYCVHVGFSKYKDFFENQTGMCHHIPYIIWESSLDIKKWFIAGVMDGDGYITLHKRTDGTIQTKIGIGSVEEGWIYEFKKLINSLGVKTNKEELLMDEKRKKPLVRFGIKTSDFIDKKLFFTIKRKKERISNYINKCSETKGCLSNDIG